MGTTAALIAAGSCFMIALWTFLVIYLWKTKCSKANKDTVHNESVLQNVNSQINGLESSNFISSGSTAGNRNIYTVGESPREIMHSESLRRCSFESQPPLYYISQHDMEIVRIFWFYFCLVCVVHGYFGIKISEKFIQK